MPAMQSAGKSKVGTRSHLSPGIRLWALMMCCIAPMLPAFGQIIEIDSIEELQLIGNDPAYPLNGHYILTQDIDASDTANWNDGKGFEPIGKLSSGYPSSGFSGTLDGGGYTISNLVINRPDENCVGLFGAAYGGGGIRDLGLDQCHVRGYRSVGGLAGATSDLTISRCSVAGEVNGATEYVGGLVGSNRSGISQCHAACLVEGEWSVGGLVGRSECGSVFESYATGDVIGSDYAGGLVGESWEDSIFRCYATGNVLGRDCCGGLIGGQVFDSVQECYACGAVTGSKYVGGLIGFNWVGDVSYCYAMGAVEGDDYVGGLVGEIDHGRVSDCYATGTAVKHGTLIYYCAGLVATCAYGTVENSFWDAITSGHAWSQHGIGLPTDAMRSLSTFRSAGWDFDDVWTISAQGSYPFLANLPQCTVPEVTGSIDVDAVKSLESAGLSARIFYDCSTEVPEGLVVSQNVPAGENINTGVPIHIVVSLGSPIPISSISELQRIGNDPDYPLDGHYALTQDIDASETAQWNNGAGFDPIGTLDWEYPERAFRGTFDGRGFSITNLTINRLDERCVGLFGGLGEGGVVRGLHLEGGMVAGDTAVGALVGYSFRASMLRCSATCEVTGTVDIGGLAGSSEGCSLSVCCSTGDVQGRNFVGGLGGQMGGCGLFACVASGDVVADGPMGGLVGYADADTMFQCRTTGAVTGVGAVGGLVGRIDFIKVLRCYATGDVSGASRVGGLAGADYYGEHTESYATGAVTGNDYVGGLIGEKEDGNILHCYAAGPVTGSLDVGGLVGYNEDGEIDASFWDTEVSGLTESAGGKGLSTAQMQTESTFVDAGWDFAVVWSMLPGGSYPYLTHVTRVAVPDVTGLAEAEALASLESMGLSAQVSYQYDSLVPAGHVISQNPAASVEVLPDAAVDLVVSLGPQPVPVPDVVGMSRADAEVAIVSSGLVLGDVTEAYSPTVPAGRVISQSPAASVEVLPGTAVDVVVSLGPEPVPVPDVVGLSRVQAEISIAAADLVVGDVTEAFSPTVPAGRVISQSPAASVEVLPGTAVDVVVSLGPEPVPVPGVVGLSRAQAEISIAAAGLVVGDVTEAYSPTVPAGRVISQIPAASAEVLPGTAVDLVVSLGPQPVPVPDVVGMSRAQAEISIAAAGLVVGDVTEAYSPTVPAGRVISQNPAASVEVLPGVGVDLVVSLGPQPVPVPDLVGMSRADAEAAIVSAGLTVGTVTEAYSATMPEGNVISQTPPGGSNALPGSTVALVVSRGPQPVGVPEVVGMTRADAEAAIAAAGLTVGEVTQVHSETVPMDVVESQNPAPLSQVLPGTAVNFVMSLGSATGDLGLDVTGIKLTRNQPSRTFHIVNLNLGELNWLLECDAGGLSVTPQSGSGNAMVTVEWLDLSKAVSATLTVSNADNPDDQEVIEILSTHPSDMTGEDSVNALDVQLVIIQTMGMATGRNCDINADGKTNAIDVQLVINAALGLW